MSRDISNVNQALAAYPAELVPTRFGPLAHRQHGRGRDLVLLHGIGSGSGSWLPLFERLGSSFRLTAWDMPGYGASGFSADKVRGLDDYAGALAALLEHLNIGSAILVAHSLGALTAARFALDTRIHLQGLFLADPAQGHSRLALDVREARVVERLNRFKEMGVEAHAHARAPNLLRSNAREDDIALVEFNMRQLTAAGYGAAARLLRDGDLLGDIAKLDMPASVVCGSEDKITPPALCREIAETFPGGRSFHEIPDAGHASYIDQPERFCEHLIQFAARCP